MLTARLNPSSKKQHATARAPTTNSKNKHLLPKPLYFQTQHMKQKETIEHEHTVAYTYLQPKGEECAKKK